VEPVVARLVIVAKVASEYPLREFILLFNKLPVAAICPLNEDKSTMLESACHITPDVVEAKT
jgi:hypothetical protein